MNAALNAAQLGLFSYIESILGAIIYIFGLAGSYYRFGSKYKRGGRLDAFYLVCIQCGGAFITISMVTILKYIFIPSLHMWLIRTVYYSGTLVACMVFFVKTSEMAKKICGLATLLTWWSLLAFVFAEGLVFYLDLPYAAALISCLGIVVICYCIMHDQPYLFGVLCGLFLVILPIIPKIYETGFNIEKMKEKKQIALENLIQESNLNQAHDRHQEIVNSISI